MTQLSISAKYIIWHLIWATWAIELLNFPETIDMPWVRFLNRQKLNQFPHPILQFDQPWDGVVALRLINDKGQISQLY